MLKLAICALILTSFLAAADEFDTFCSDHGKYYPEPIYSLRKGIFYDNLKNINELNEQSPTTGITVGKTFFTDITTNEMPTFYGYLGLDQTRLAEIVKQRSSNQNTFVAPLLPWDWRAIKKCMPKVMNQGKCGSCYAFSVSQAIEGQICIKYNKVQNLSEAELRDCYTSKSPLKANHVCQGGYMYRSYAYIKAIGGLTTEESYPYTENVTGHCLRDYTKVGAKIVDYKNFTAGDERDMLDHINKRGPISVAFDASHDSFKYYKGGPYDEPKCNATNLVHAMTIVGYTLVNFKWCWIVQNSWGAKWGDNGYIYVVMGKNMCGIANMASAPTDVQNCNIMDGKVVCA